MLLRTSLALLLSGGLTASTVAQPPQTNGLPVWLAAKVAEFQRLPPFNPPRSILRTQYQGKVAFHISPACCDIPSELYDEQGVLLCFPTGGFAGGDGRCPGFLLDEGQATLVWRDARQR